jgi:GT2 family glycosyltransferase
VVTVVVVPRERWSYARTSLHDLLANTAPPFDLVYVLDASAPEPLRSTLAADVIRHGGRVVASDVVLTPNQARNLGAAGLAGGHVVFIDNDTLVEPGWLAALVACADETGAWIVGPLICEGLPRARTVHMAGGPARVVDGGFIERHRHGKKPLATLIFTNREPVGQVEFHCMLLHRDSLARLLPLDPELLSLAEHSDVCMRARAAGGEVWYEPASIVTYVPGEPERGERAYYARRWSDDWNRRSLDRFAAKWRLRPDDPWIAESLRFGAAHRLRGLLTGRLFGERLGDPLSWKLVDALNLLHLGPGR